MRQSRGRYQSRSEQIGSSLSYDSNFNPKKMQIMVSSNADHSNAVPLSGSLSGTKYVFVPNYPGITGVSFYLDGTLVRTEAAAPWDYQGTTAGNGNPWDTSAVADGSHTIRADVTADGRVYQTQSSFTVENVITPPPSGTPLYNGDLSNANSVGYPDYDAWEYAGVSFTGPALFPVSQVVTCATSVDGISPPVGLYKVLRSDLRQADGVSPYGNTWRTMGRWDPTLDVVRDVERTFVWFTRYPTDMHTRYQGSTSYYTDFEIHYSGQVGQGPLVGGFLYRGPTWTAAPFEIRGRTGDPSSPTTAVNGALFDSSTANLGVWHCVVLRYRFGQSGSGLVQAWHGKVGTDSAVVQKINWTGTLGYASDSPSDQGFLYHAPHVLYWGSLQTNQVIRSYGAGYRVYASSTDALGWANYILGSNV